MTGVIGTLAGLVPQGIRYGAEFRRYRRLLEKSQWWPRERLEAYQLEKLQETVRYAYHTVPFYRDTFDAHGVGPDDLRKLDDIRRFPTMDKEIILENYDRMLAPQLEGQQLMPFTTGGTTGSGVLLLFEEAFRQREQAFIWRLWNEVGYRRGILAAILQHRECPEDINDGLWYPDKVSNAMILSAHRLTRETVGRYLDAIDAHRPRVLIAYPSLAWMLLTYAREAGREKLPFDLVLCGSETLYDFQRRIFETFFEAPVRIHYGHLESCALFGYCRYSNLYHVQLEYGHTEFLKDDDEQAGPGELGEIVATGFDNRAMPLIRFRTRDWAQVSDERCVCGRDYPLVDKIQGRDGDFLRTPSGKAHSPVIIEVLMDQMLLDGYSGFADLQIVQEKLDEVVVNVAPGKGFTNQELERFCELLSARLEGEVKISTEFVAEIPRSRRQKKRLIVSHLKDSHSESWPER